MYATITSSRIVVFHTAPEAFTVNSSCLLLVGIYGVTGDADPVGGPGGVDGDGQPADEGDPGGGTLLQLHVQGGVRRAWGGREG